MSPNGRLLMNEDPEKFHNSNVLSTRDAIICLKEYAHKFDIQKRNVKIIDIGSGDGRVTNILKSYIPKNYEYLIGSDLSGKMVEFANKHYQNERTKFITLDIEGDLSDSLKDKFDYVFSFYTFNWIRKQQKAFTNVYNLLTGGGICFAIFMAYTPIYTIFLALSRCHKWEEYLKNVNQFVSLYHNLQDPDREVINVTKEIGFQKIDVKCRQMTFAYDSVQQFKDLIAAINPFNIPEEMKEDFLDDYYNIGRNLGMVDDIEEKVLLIYNLLVVYCVK